MTRIPNPKNAAPRGVRTPRSIRRITPRKCNRNNKKSALGITPQIQDQPSPSNPTPRISPIHPLRSPLLVLRERVRVRVLLRPPNLAPLRNHPLPFVPLSLVLGGEGQGEGPERCRARLASP